MLSPARLRALSAALPGNPARGLRGRIMDDCNFTAQCCFFNKIRDAEALLWQSQMRTYCLGPLYQRCERRRFFLETGDCAPAHITPSGEVPELFFTLK